VTSGLLSLPTNYSELLLLLLLKCFKTFSATEAQFRADSGLFL